MRLVFTKGKEKRFKRGKEEVEVVRLEEEKAGRKFFPLWSIPLKYKTMTVGIMFFVRRGKMPLLDADHCLLHPSQTHKKTIRVGMIISPNSKWMSIYDVQLDRLLFFVTGPTLSMRELCGRGDHKCGISYFTDQFSNTQRRGQTPYTSISRGRGMKKALYIRRMRWTDNVRQKPTIKKRSLPKKHQSFKKLHGPKTA